MANLAAYLKSTVQYSTVQSGCAFSLVLKSDIKKEINVAFDLSLLNIEKEKVNAVSKISEFHGQDEFSSHIFVSELEICDPNKGLLVDGSLTIYCTVGIPSDVLYPVPPCNLVAHLTSAMAEGLLSDFTLAVGEEKFQVHKLILSIRSPVFRRMMESPMLENANSEVEISDFKPEVVKEMIHYMYTGQAPNLNKMVAPLLDIADKYKLLRLKELCGEALARDLDVENAIATLILAELHNVSRLKVISMNFIEVHISAVAKTPHWSVLKTQESGLYIEFLESLARHHALPEEVIKDFAESVSVCEPPCKRPRLTKKGGGNLQEI